MIDTKKIKLKIFSIILLLILASCKNIDSPKNIDSIELASPDKKLVVSINNVDSLTYKLSLNGDVFIEKSELGISIDENDVYSNMEIKSVEKKSNNYSYPSMENSDVAYDVNNEYTIRFEDENGTNYDIVWKIWDNAAAYQYVFNNSKEKRIDYEDSEFKLDPNSTVYYNTELLDMQEIYQVSKVSDMKENTIMAALPTFKLPNDQGYVCIGEANLKDYSGMALKYMGNNTFKSHYWNTINGFDTSINKSPWRIIFAADNLNDLVNNTIAQNLNDEPGEDFTWVETGKATWFHGADKEGKIIEDEAIKNLEAAQRLDIRYMVIGNNWRNWSEDENTAFEKVAKIAELCEKYGVGLFIGNDVPDMDLSGDNMYDPDIRRDFLKKAKNAGVSGIKFGHIQTETPQAINVYREISEDAANEKLLVIFHNSNKPTGLNRTYPNFLTQEGVKGMQYNLSTTNANIIPYTRLITGGADFTPLNLANSTRMGDGTLSHMLANTVIIRSNLLTFMETPYNIDNSEVNEFISKVHSSWDETIVLNQSEIGELSAFVRKKDNQYFLAIQNSNTKDKKIEIKLDFLDENKKYKSLEFRDDFDDKSNAIKNENEYQKNDIIEVELLSGGGFVSIFEEVE